MTFKSHSKAAYDLHDRREAAETQPIAVAKFAPTPVSDVLVVYKSAVG